MENNVHLPEITLSKTVTMIALHGEYECKIDPKSRLRLPSPLLRQMDLEVEQGRTFFVNRGFEQCLMIYPKRVWDGIVKNIRSLNVYRKNEREFIRYFFRGVQAIELDSADRLLLSKSLMQYAGIDKEAVLFAYLDRIELWDKETYEAVLDNEPAEFSRLAEQVFGDER